MKKLLLLKTFLCFLFGSQCSWFVDNAARTVLHAFTIGVGLDQGYFVLHECYSGSSKIEGSVPYIHFCSSTETTESVHMILMSYCTVH